MNGATSSPIRRFLAELADQARSAEVARNLARTALNDARHFGRSQDVIDDLARKLAELEGPAAPRLEVPGPVLDPVSVEYAAVGGPRAWAEERVLNQAGNAAMENAAGPSSEVTDALRGNALMRSRLERLTPEQRAQSIATIAFQAQDDAAVAAMQRQAAAERRRVQTKAVADAIGTAARKYSLPAVAAGLTGYGVYDAVSRKRQEMADEAAAREEYQRVLDDRLSRKISHLDNRVGVQDALGQMADEITFSSAMGSMEDDVRGWTNPVIPEPRMPEMDIFQDDPALSWEPDDPYAAIQRVLDKRYGR